MTHVLTSALLLNHAAPEATKSRNGFCSPAGSLTMELTQLPGFHYKRKQVSVCLSWASPTDNVGPG